jgi:hypothetical protein
MKTKIRIKVHKMQSLTRKGREFAFRPLLKALLFAGMIVFLASSSGFAQLPVEVEGPISAMPDVQGTAPERFVTLTVFGVEFVVREGTPISTPTRADLTIDELADTIQRPFPAERSQASWAALRS